MKEQHLNVYQVRQHLEIAVKAGGGIRAFSRFHGVSYQFIWMILHGHRKPSPSIAALIGLEEVPSETLWRVAKKHRPVSRAS